LSYASLGPFFRETHTITSNRRRVNAPPLANLAPLGGRTLRGPADPPPGAGRCVLELDPAAGELLSDGIRPGEVPRLPRRLSLGQ